MRTKHRLAIGSVAVLFGGLLAALLGTGPAWTHGTATAPASRTYLCYIDGHWTGGDLDPRNAACQNAVAIGGKQPLWDWYGVLRADGAGQMQGYIPDGQLCSGGNTKYAGFDVPRDDWPVTHLTANSDWTFHYNAWVPHPGTFRLYITKDGFDPTVDFTWDMLDLTPFSTWSESTPNGDAEYNWPVTLPNKTGRHIIYSVWQRTDSNETFYGCSDVVFDGGSGEVTGFPTGTASPTTTAPTTATTAPTTATTAPTTAPTTTTTATGSTESGCTATYQVVSSWPGGFQGEVTVSAGNTALVGWTVNWTFADGQVVTQLWSGISTQSGADVTVNNAAWNGTLAANASTTFGFLASWNDSTNSLPTPTCLAIVS